MKENTKGKFFTTRIDPEILELMTQVSKIQRETRAVLVRRAIMMELARLSYLSDEQKKALGIQRKEGSGI